MINIISIIAILTFFTILSLKVKSEWGSPILYILTGGISYMFGVNAPDIIDGQYATSDFSLTVAMALIIYSLVCIAWSWNAMFSNR